MFIALHSRQSVIKAHVLLVIQYASSLQVGAFWSVIRSVMAGVAAAAARSVNTPPRHCNLGGAAAESEVAHWLPRACVRRCQVGCIEGFRIEG